jgi:hypothetical protein
LGQNESRDKQTKFFILKRKRKKEKTGPDPAIQPNEKQKQKNILNKQFPPSIGRPQ